MPHYVDGFVLPIPKKNLNAYRRMAQKAGKVWREQGAVEFRECVGDDLKVKMGLPFPRGIKLKPGETVLFSYIVFKSRGHRDRQCQGDERSAFGEHFSATVAIASGHRAARVPTWCSCPQTHSS
jgi:uncharacterized protein YbaA (DUF1428 family)